MAKKTAVIKMADRPVRLGRDNRAIRAELQTIKDANSDGLLKPDEVVRRAESDESPLHRYFEWADDKAAHQWRLTQARALIRTVEVVMPNDKSESFVPKFVSLRFDRAKEGGGYREIGDVVNSTKFLEELEQTAKKDIEAVLKRYEALRELCTKVRSVL